MEGWRLVCRTIAIERKNQNSLKHKKSLVMKKISHSNIIITLLSIIGLLLVVNLTKFLLQNKQLEDTNAIIFYCITGLALGGISFWIGILLTPSQQKSPAETTKTKTSKLVKQETLHSTPKRPTVMDFSDSPSAKAV